MVSLSEIQASNSRISSALPAELVAAFFGATSGIGEATLKQFAKHAKRPRIYYVGRSQEAGDRIALELKELNSEGEYTFIKADLSLIRAVDDVCSDIKSREKAINLLFLTMGSLVSHTETPEGLHAAQALAYHSRARTMQNLLPLLRSSPSLRRIVTVFAATKEGPIIPSDFHALNIPMLAARGHTASMITLSLEALAASAPEMSFVHCFPGFVRTNIGRDVKGVGMAVMRGVFAVLGPLFSMKVEESGERHLFLATSARYPARGSSGEVVAEGVPTAGAVAVGTDGEIGSGVYSINSDGESAGQKVVELLGRLRKEGMVEKVWEHTQGEFDRITGSEAV